MFMSIDSLETASSTTTSNDAANAHDANRSFAMREFGWNRKAYTIVAAWAAGAAAVAVAIAWVYPEPVESPVLGTEWQCYRVAIVTTCTQVKPRTAPNREITPRSAFLHQQIEPALSRSPQNNQ